jgi:hypothetical protein
VSLFSGKLNVNVNDEDMGYNGILLNIFNDEVPKFTKCSNINYINNFPHCSIA